MYHFIMKKENIRKILQQHYSDSMVRAILRGVRAPTLEKAILLDEQHDIPVKCWKDIKSFISADNSTTNNEVNSNAKKEKKVS